MVFLLSTGDVAMKLSKYTQDIFQGNCLTRSWYSNWVKYPWQVVCCIRWRVCSRQCNTHTVSTWGSFETTAHFGTHIYIWCMFSQPGTTSRYVVTPHSCLLSSIYLMIRQLFIFVLRVKFCSYKPIVYLRLKGQILFLQAKTILTVFALWGTNGNVLFNIEDWRVSNE